MKRRVFITTVAVLSVACSPRAPEPLTVGYISISECLPLFVAKDQGYFEDEGVSVRLESLTGGARILEVLRSGTVDIGFTNAVSLIFARSNGDDFFPIYGASYESQQNQNHALLTRGGLDPKSLNGKKVAVNTVRNIEELMVRIYLRRAGIDPIKSDITFHAIGFPQMLPALEAGNIEAASVVEPFITAAKNLPSVRILDNHYLKAAPNLPRILVATYVSSAKTVSSKAAHVRAFERAMQRAVQFIQSNEVEARRSLLKYTRLSEPDVSRIGLPAFENSPSLEDFEAIKNLMVGEGFLSRGAGDSALAKMRIGL